MKYLPVFAIAAFCANPALAQDTTAPPAEPPAETTRLPVTIAKPPPPRPVVQAATPPPRPTVRVIPSPPKPPHPDGNRPAMPKENWYAKVEPVEYPQEAYLNGEQGVVGYTLMIDSAGNIKDCKVVESSGSATLDEATCKIALAREGGFEPATNKQGKPVAGEYFDEHFWQIRKPELQNMLVEVSMRHNSDGSITNCELVRAEGDIFPELKREDPCKNMGRLGDVYRDENGVPVSKNVRVTMQVEVTDPAEEAAK